LELGWELNFLFASTIICVMKCPSCSNQLRQVKFKSVVVDYCPSCRGIWFDSGEFLEVVRSIPVRQQNGSDERSSSDEQKPQSLYTTVEGERNCPVCSERMGKFNYSYDSNVFLDRCSNCGGIWADRGEVKAVARYLKRVTKIEAPKRRLSQAGRDAKGSADGAGMVGEVKRIAASDKDESRVAAIREDLKKAEQRLQKAKDFAELGNVLSMRISPAVFLMAHYGVPISDDNPRERFPIVTISIVVLCAIIFLGQVFLVAEPKAFFERFGFVPHHFFSIGLFSSMFLHAGVLHLIGNMYFFWIFGDNVEDRFSRLGFLVFYLCCGLAASALHAIIYQGSPVPCIGASGAISGIMGAYCVFYPRAKVKVFLGFLLEVPAFVYLGAWFSLQLYFGWIYSIAGMVGGVAWFAHIGGFVFGISVGFVKKKLRAVKKQHQLGGIA